MKRTILLSLLALGVSARALAQDDVEDDGDNYTDDYDQDDDSDDSSLDKRYWPETVTVTQTRTFTDYCGCGIPGVPTIGPVVTSTTTVISGTTTVIPTTTYTTTSGGFTVGPVSSTTTVISGTTTVVPVTTTTTMSSTMSTTTTTGGATVGPISTTTVISGTTTVVPVTTTTTTTTAAATTETTSTTDTTSTTSTAFTQSTSIFSSSTIIVPPNPTTSIATSAVSTSSSSSTTTGAPVVTDAAYISTVLRHHNVHRANHSAPNMVWSASLAETARKIAQTCQYGHDTSVDGGGYGQNIGAGYPANQMGVFITEGLYNSEVNLYDPSWYGPNGPPANANTGQAGHFTQIVWVASTNVGCFTADCSATGLTDKSTGQPLNSGIPPLFTVCNYQATGNVGGAYGQNVLAPGNPPAATVFGNYGCPSNINCVA